LTELLLGDLEVLVAIPILEERLGVESVLADDFSETVENGLDLSLLFIVGRSASIQSVSAGVIELLVDVLLEALFGEHFINSIAEVSPADVLTSLGGFEGFAE